MNGNLNQHDSHYVEGQSAAYRMVLTGMSPGTHTLDIGFDITHGGKHAIDFLTSARRIVELVDPCDGVAPCVAGAQYPVPIPAGSPMPLDSFNALPQAERNFTIYNGAIAAAVYTTQGVLTDAQSEARVRITFMAASPTVVLAWGGHIGSSLDWPSINATTGIGGSPYHMRLIALDGTGGNQDRSMKEETVIPVHPLGASLTIVKTVVNDAGGLAAPADFSIHVFDDLGADVTGSPAPGDPFGTSYVNLPAGMYTVAEDAVDGYLGTFVSGDCAADGSIILLDGDIKECDLQNDDQRATLTVTKVVDNGDGGTATVAAFDLFVDDTQVASGVAATFPAGDYLVSETGLPGYTGTFSGNCAADGSISLAVGDHKACTLTNDDIQPLLTVTKVVENDNGGTLQVADFPLYIDDLLVTSGQASGVHAGTYTVSEVGDAGYAAAFGGACDANGQVSLAVGESKECIITNRDIQPMLTVVKVFVNDNGGTAVVGDAQLFVDDTSVASGEANGFDVGDHVVSEIGPAGYNEAIDGACTADGHVALALADAKTCTITNDDIQPILTVIKVVHSDNGGTLGVADFPLFVGLVPVGSGDANGFNAGDYVVSETGDAGYAAAFSGACDADGEVHLDIGDAKTCILTNDDIQPILTVTKLVTNDNGGLAEVGDFLLSVDDQSVLSGVPHGFDAGTYAISEDGPAGYAASFDAACAEGSIVLAVGDDKECTITNDDIQPKLTLHKLVVNDNGGDAVAADWDYMVEDTQVDLDETVGFDAGTYAIGESGPAGYLASFGESCAEGSIQLFVGDDKQCTITNDDIQPKLKVTKVVENDHGGLAVADDWSFFVGDVQVVRGAATGFNAGQYQVTEQGPAGYALAVSGNCDADGMVALAIGEQKECILTNSDIQPILNVSKVVVNDDGGTAQVADWEYFVDLVQVQSGVPTGIDASPTLFQIREFGPAGYALAFSGDCAANGTIALAVGDVKQCVLTNDDIRPTLAVHKLVTNNDGGTAAAADWTFLVNDTVVQLDAVTGFMAGAYHVSEAAGPAGYAGTFAGDCDAAGHVVLHVGDAKQCWLTNDDMQPYLRVVKHVINDDAGAKVAANFTLFVAGVAASPASFNGAEGGVLVELNAGAYAVTEGPAPGYTASFSADCTGTIALGELRTCTVTNNDNPVATRTQGFWSTHTAFTNAILATKLGGSLTVGAAPHKGLVTNAAGAGQSQLYGAFFADISKMTLGGKRTVVEQARMILAQQLVAAKLNCAAFGCSPASLALITAGDAAYAAGNAAAITAAASALDAFNNSHDALPIPASLPSQGSATSQLSQSLAYKAFWNAP
ncbi:MAG: hypothetical protein V4510_04940 [bacterium]